MVSSIMPAHSVPPSQYPFPCGLGILDTEAISKRISFLSSLLGPCILSGVSPLTLVRENPWSPPGFSVLG